jgi:hypothetical protein
MEFTVDVLNGKARRKSDGMRSQKPTAEEQ